MGGPFTLAAEVDKYIAAPDIDEDSKVRILYLEVHSTHDPSLSLPKASELFCLLKNHKKLPLNTYAVNLTTYPGSIPSRAEVTLQDFSQVMDTILRLKSEFVFICIICSFYLNLRSKTLYVNCRLAIGIVLYISIYLYV